jgi:hypothetical protein
MESSFERDNEPSGSIKCWETTEWLNNWWPLMRYSSPQSYVSYVKDSTLHSNCCEDMEF